MTASGIAIGKMLLRRHRRGLGATAAGLALLVLAVAVAPAESASVTALACILLSLAAFHLVAVFALGFDTDVAGAGSCYPARMFALPVRTVALAGWPMAFGAAALALLWFAAAGLIFRPWGLKVPLDWPALLFATQFVWTLAMLWWPFGLSWARVVVGLFLGHLPATGTIYAIQTGEPIASLAIYLGTFLAVGGALAYLGVRRARSGAVLRWDWLPKLRDRSSAGLKPPFGSARRAQAWFEHRRHGFVLPMMVALVLPLGFLPFFFDEPVPQALVRNFLLVAILPWCLAGVAGTNVGKHNAWARDHYGLPSFTATRPVTTVAMVVAMLRAAARSALLAWAVTAALTVVAVVLSGMHGEILQLWRNWCSTRSTGEIVGTAGTAAVLLPLLTWKRLIENLLIGLTGSEWIIKGSLFVGVFVFFSAIGLAMWVLIHPEYHADLRNWLPFALATLAALKFALAALVVRGLRRHRLLADSTLLLLGGGWLAFVASLSALAIWLVPAGTVPALTLASIVVLMMPLVRVSAMPLALHWNRHR